MRGKYIIFEDENGMKYPVIFPDYVPHDIVSIYNAKPASAGEFLTREEDDTSPRAIFLKRTVFYCRGKSISLGKSSREEDSKDLTNYFREDQ